MQLAKLASVLAVATMAAHVSTAQAATITNHDDKAYTIYVVEDGEQREISVEPQAEVGGICAVTCNIGMNKDEDLYEIAANDVLLIEEGQLLLVEPEPQAEPSGEPSSEQNQ